MRDKNIELVYIWHEWLRKSEIDGYMKACIDELKWRPLRSKSEGSIFLTFMEEHIVK